MLVKAILKICPQVLSAYCPKFCTAQSHVNDAGIPKFDSFKRPLKFNFVRPPCNPTGLFLGPFVTHEHG